MLARLTLSSVSASPSQGAEPLRLANGRPFVCVYHFGHQSEPSL